MLLLLFFRHLLASLTSCFSPSKCPRIPHALRVGLAALSCSLAGFEAVFWVDWVGAEATGRNKSYGGFCLRAPPSNHCHHLSTFKAYRQLYLAQSSTWLLVGKAGWLASGTRGRLICQLRQFGPLLCGPPYRRPTAESSHGCYGRRALFQELYIIYKYICIYCNYIHIKSYI